MEWVLLSKEEFFKAQIIRSKLESEGIPVRIDSESVGRMYGITLNGLGGAKIYVPKEVEEKARETLRHAEEE